MRTNELIPVERRSTGRLGSAIVVAGFAFSLAVSVYHIWIHTAPSLAILLGQGELLLFSIGFGLAGHYAFTRAEDPRERDTIGMWAGAGYILAGLVSGGYALHQHLSPEATLSPDAILFQATFVALVGGTAGIFLGLEKARRKRTITDLDETVRELDATREEIRTEKQRFESLFQNAPSAIADLKYTGGEPTVVRANTVFENLLDRTNTAVEGKNLFKVVPLRETSAEEEVAAHVVENEIYEGEVTVEEADARSHYKLRVIPYEVGKEGERAFALYTDVTELRQTQENLKESIERLEESNERLEQFAYAASHDLKEPLRMVSSYLQLIDDRYGDDLDEDGREFIDFAVDGADRMRAMIESLLEYSRVTTRGDPLQPTDAEAVLDDVLTDLKPRIEETDASISVDELPTVLADADQLAQVFRNLISNALTYSGDEPPQVHVGSERMANEVRFAVDDQGIGIPPDRRDQIFEVFQTLHTDEEGSGSGIGLALCQRIIERHDGEIWVESEPGEGTTFYFTLPLTEEDRSTLIAQPPAQEEGDSDRCE